MNLSYRVLISCFSLCLLTACATAPSALRGAGRAAVEINQLWWFMLVTGSAIYVGVMSLLLMAYRRNRAAAPTDATVSTEAPLTAAARDLVPAAAGSTRLIILGGIVMPSIVLSAVYAFTLETLWSISGQFWGQQRPEPLTIEVIGHQWWWEVRYPAHGIITANELYLPVDQPVRIELTSEDVIHSFWVPELHGKLDMIPGRTNSFWLEANEPGDYWGICAEFCGIQHANMLYLVLARPQAAFDEWLAAQQVPPSAPTTELARQGQQIFFEATCDRCHAIAGTAAAGRLGPDLTHLASRRTLASGILDNNIGSLGGWILNPQHIKPGNLMPSSDLSGPELQALLAYLATLE